MLIGTALAPSLWWLLLPALIGGVLGGMFNAAAGALFTLRAPEELRGRVIAAILGATRAASTLALALGGAVGALIGPRLTYAVCGAATVAAAPLVLRIVGTVGEPDRVL